MPATVRLYEFQNEVGTWATKNFGIRSSHQPLLGIGEEVGELMHAQLKGEQGIRHTDKEIQRLKEDAVGDILVYLADYCYTNGIDLESVVNETWSRVSKRDWQNNKIDGGEQ